MRSSGPPVAARALLPHSGAVTSRHYQGLGSQLDIFLFQLGLGRGLQADF